MANVVNINVRANDQTRGFAGVKAGLEQALGGLGGIAKIAGADLASSLSGPIVAAAGVGVAALASVGAALGGFAAAAAPQWSSVTSATDLYTKAQASAAAGSASAAKDMEAYKTALAQLPPATRATAVAFAGLKDDFKKWSDSLAPKTMPIFTKGIEVMRSLLPSLTPLVNAAADSLSKFMDTIQKDVSGGGIQKFIGKLADAARNILPGFLASIRNVAIGLGGFISAFLPFTSGIGSGMEKLTAKFAAFGQSLGSNPAFQKWMQDMQARGPVIISLLGNLIKTILNIAQALAPFTGLTLAVASALAKFVAAIPQGVMDWLAPTIAGIVLAIRAWAVVQGILNVVLAANPIGLVVLAIAALVAGLIYAYKHSETFRNIVQGAWAVVKSAIIGAWNAIRPALSALAEFFTGTVAPAAQRLAEKMGSAFGKIKDLIKGAWDVVKPILAEFGKFIENTLLPSVDKLVTGIAGVGEGIGGLSDKFKELTGLGSSGKGKDDKKDNKSTGKKILDFVAPELTMEYWNKLGPKLAKAIDVAAKAAQKAFNGLKKVFSSSLSFIEDHWQDFYNGIINTAQDAISTVASTILTGVRKIVSWFLSPWPGAQARFNGFMRGLNRSVQGMISSVGSTLRRLPGIVAGIASRAWTSLSSQLNRVAGQVRSIAGRMWSAIPASLRSAASQVYGILSGLSGYVGSVLSGIANRISSAIHSIPGFASGGIVGAAGGGPRSNLVMVGEQGRELVRLPFGSTVMPHGQTEGMMGGGGGGGRTVIEIKSGGSRMDDMLVELLRNAIRLRGGNVQTALGR